MNQYYIILLFVLLFSNCESQKKKDNSVPAALFLLNSQSISQSALNSVCPPAQVPDGIFIADSVVNFTGDINQPFKDPQKAINGICGAGESSGSVDVFSLDAKGESSSIVLEWKNKKVLNEPGPDFVVYENAFTYSNPVRYFIEPTIVEVSKDQQKWCGWSVQYKGFNNDLNLFSQNPSDWINFAGLTPVTYNMGINNLSHAQIFVEKLGGGDFFDLDELVPENTTLSGQNCDSEEVLEIQKNGFSYIRLTAATNRKNPSTGDFFPLDSNAFGGGPDIDGVVARKVEN